MSRIKIENKWTSESRIYEDLKKNGTMFYDVDYNNNGIYSHTVEYWLLDQDVYIHEIHPNKMQYTGKTGTYFYLKADNFTIDNDDILEAFQKVYKK